MEIRMLQLAAAVAVVCGGGVAGAGGNVRVHQQTVLLRQGQRCCHEWQCWRCCRRCLWCASDSSVVFEVVLMPLLLLKGAVHGYFNNRAAQLWRHAHTTTHQVLLLALTNLGLASCCLHPLV
eukprot:GHRQ01022276.1.p1 GENE.GHRQ01022276.1~~GHRQ01022276.1.p1  ORF type:complete len:122 (-),score=33.30 GHRQ01022276.1:624-989(-)